MAVIDALGMRLRILDQLIEALRWNGMRHRDRVAVFRDQRNSHDIGQLVLGVAVEQRVDRVEIGAQQQIVTVARPRQHIERGEQGAGAGLVFDHHRLAEGCAQSLGQEARRNVGRPSRGETEHQP